MNWDLTRTAWLAGAPWGSSPAFPAWSAIDLILIHWPGSNGIPVSGDPARVEQTLRNMQSSWLNGKGYNLGYSAGVDWLGRRIEIRGDTARNAANAPAALNARSMSILVLTNLDGAMTDDQVAGVSDLVGQILEQAPGAQVIGHRDGPQFVAGATATQCPGDAIQARVDAGEFYPSTTPGPEPGPDPTPEPPEVDDMPGLLIQAGPTSKTPGAHAVADVALTAKQWIRAGDAAALTATGFYGPGLITIDGATFDAIPGEVPVNVVD